MREITQFRAIPASRKCARVVQRAAAVKMKLISADQTGASGFHGPMDFDFRSGSLAASSCAIKIELSHRVYVATLLSIRTSMFTLCRANSFGHARRCPVWLRFSLCRWCGNKRPEVFIFSLTFLSLFTRLQLYLKYGYAR